MIPPDDLCKLIAIGSIESDSDPQLDEILSTLTGCAFQSRGWELGLSDLAETELRHLTRGLTRAELHGIVGSGSVSPVIWAYGAYERRFPDQAEALAGWILQRRTNPWVPYGRLTYGSTLSEVAEADERKRQARLLRSVQVVDSDHDRARRKERRQRTARDRGSPHRDLLLQELATLSVPDQLRRVVKDEEYSPGYYPATVPMSVELEHLRSLTSEERVELLRRLKGKTRGPWKRVKSMIIEEWGSPWNRRLSSWQ